jgi:hypothetical protein
MTDLVVCDGSSERDQRRDESAPEADLQHDPSTFGEQARLACLLGRATAWLFAQDGHARSYQRSQNLEMAIGWHGDNRRIDRSRMKQFLRAREGG